MSNFQAHLILSSADDFNLNESNILLLGNELTLSQRINLRLIKTERICRQQFEFDEICRNVCKWVESFNVMTNISFSHSVFKRLVLQTHKKLGFVVYAEHFRKA